MVSHYKTDNDAWFAIGDQHDLNFIWETKPRTGMERTSTPKSSSTRSSRASPLASVSGAGPGAGAAVSWRTISGGASLSSLGPTNLDNGQLGLCFAASGMSLIYRSGNTIYTVGASAVSAAAP
jgi:hypothetical protein